MSNSRPDPNWALGHLRVRLKAFVAGHVPFAALTSAVTMAQQHGVSTDAIRDTLQEHAGAPDAARADQANRDRHADADSVAGVESD